MKKLPIGKQNFESIITDGYLYVDKTRQIYDLIEGGSLYFLSRPRRFGKSLLVSVLQHIFQGRKDLFEGLYIAEKTTYDWQTFPVLTFNFSKLGSQVRHLEQLLKDQIEEKANDFDITLTKTGLATALEELVKKLSKKLGAVVILIDEYDAPIVDFLTETAQANKNREVIRDFFSPLKDLEFKGHIRFLFITGISKFSKVSLFSKFNNPIDLTLKRTQADLLGITKEELLANFEAHIQRSAKVLNMSRSQLLEWVKLWYNGYSWDGKTWLYNPFSLLNFFDDSTFSNYWFATGTPTFLVETIRRKGIKPVVLESKTFYDTYFNQFTIEQLDIYNLLFQTGYLTIKKAVLTIAGMRYHLDYPNQEVKQAFIYNLLEAFTFQAPSTISEVLINIQDALETGDVPFFIDQLKILLSDISYHLMPKKAKPKKEQTEEERAEKERQLFAAWEGYFHTIIYLVTTFLGLSVQTEVSKHQGRLDLIAQTTDFLYLMKFKLDESAQDAIQQIKDRAYAASYKNTTKTLFLVGVNFSKSERNIKTFRAEVWER